MNWRELSIFSICDSLFIYLQWDSLKNLYSQNIEHLGFPSNFSFSETPLALELENIYNAKKQHLGLFGQMKPILMVLSKLMIKIQFPVHFTVLSPRTAQLRDGRCGPSFSIPLLGPAPGLVV